MGTPTGDLEILRLEGLERSFGEQLVLRGIDLVMRRGDRVIVRGSNGAGKSTMLRCIAGVLVPTAGAVVVGGHPAGSMQARSTLGVSLSQDRSFYLRLSGRENLLFFARLRLRSKKRAQAEVLGLQQELDLGGILDRRMSTCSTGMVQQVALARALIGAPHLLVMDEPTRSLDDDAVARFWGALDRRPECAAIVATHRHEDLEGAERILDLDD